MTAQTRAQVSRFRAAMTVLQIAATHPGLINLAKSVPWHLAWAMKYLSFINI